MREHDALDKSLRKTIILTMISEVQLPLLSIERKFE
jgi:hypothetical protein